eukprot:CAMPEP_0182890546 /NCGR_PEP_ID=MMETSP0034_2-20130328/22722_1 /TAXON_ID=156128 /ORGANISM="Nephroselmis pyriformis, Strain CCMP717" /LENGTH=1379 /DNA_ID=CAMNT_0025024103 /DNA_START=107 /DNA_END=4243 /DNA_ORIENTATION=+
MASSVARSSPSSSQRPGKSPMMSPMMSPMVASAHDPKRGLNETETNVLAEYSVASLSSQIQNRTPNLVEYDHSESRGNLRSQGSGGQGPIPAYTDMGGAEVLQFSSPDPEGNTLRLPPLYPPGGGGMPAWNTPRGDGPPPRPSTVPEHGLGMPEGLMPTPPATSYSIPAGMPPLTPSRRGPVSLEARLIPTGDQEVNILEVWLNEMLARPPPRDDVTGAPLPVPPGRGLYTAGLDRNQLTAAGLGDESVDRLYRGIYTHSMAMQALMRAELSRAVYGGRNLSERSLEALKKVTERLYSEGAPILPGGSKIPLSPPMMPMPPPGPAPPGSAGPPGSAQTLPHTYADAVGGPPPPRMSTAPQRVMAEGTELVDIAYYKEEMSRLLETKGQFDSRMQVLHRMVEQEREAIRTKESAIKGLEADVAAKAAEAVSIDEGYKRRLEDMEKKIEQAGRMRKWLEQAVEEGQGKFNAEKVAHKSLQKEHEDAKKQHIAMRDLLERNINDIKTQMRKLEDQLHVERQNHAEAKGERDTYKRDLENINEKMQAEYDEYSRMKTEYHELDRARIAAHELYDEETNMTAGLRTENGELKDKVLAMESFARELQVKISAGKRTVETVRKVVKTRENDIVQLKEKVAGLAAAAAAYDSVCEQKAGVERALVMKEHELEDMRSTCLARVRDIHSLSGERSALNSELDRLKEDLHLNEIQRNKLKEELAVKSGQADQLKRQLDQAVDKATMYQSKTEKLDQDLRKMSARNEELEMKGSELSNQVKSLELSVDQGEQQVNKLIKQKADAEREWQIERERLNQESLRYRREDMTIDEVSGELHNTRTDLARLKGEHDELERRYTKMKHDMQKVTESWKTVEAETKDLADRLSISRDKIEALVQEKAHVSEALARCEEELAQTREELEHERQNGRDAKDLLQMLRDQLAALQKKFDQSEEAMRMYGIQIESERAAEQADIARHDDVILGMQQVVDKLTLELEHANAKVAEYSLELKHSAEVQGQLIADLTAALRAYDVERAVVAESASDLRVQFVSLVDEIGGDLHGSKEVTKQMLRAKDEFVKLSHTLSRQSRALMITQEVDERLRMEKDVADKVAHAAENRKRESERFSAARIQEGQIRLAAEMKKRREMAVEHGRHIETLSTETMQGLMAEHLMTLDRMESELEQVKKEGYGHQTLNELERVRKMIKDVEDELEVEKQNHASSVNDRDEKISVLVDKLQQETHARRWREKYSLQLSQQLKDAKVDLIKYGHRTQLAHKGVQTAYAELWGRTMLDEMEAERARWHDTAGGKGQDWVARARSAVQSQKSSRGGSRGRGSATATPRAKKGPSPPGVDRGVGPDEPLAPVEEGVPSPQRVPSPPMDPPLRKSGGTTPRG